MILKYGVCDSIEQFAEYYNEYKGDVWFVKVKRCDQPENGGWRWHKWGGYIGNHNNIPEYLYDANGENGYPRIDEQYIFSTENPQQNVCGLDPYQRYTISNGVITKHEVFRDSFVDFLNSLIR